MDKKIILTIHPAADMFGTYWAVLKDEKEIKSFYKNCWTLDEVKKELKKQYNTEIKVNGKLIVSAI